jgi:hypothetical protein
MTVAQEVVVRTSTGKTRAQRGSVQRRLFDDVRTIGCDCPMCDGCGVREGRLCRNCDGSGRAAIPFGR